MVTTLAQQFRQAHVRIGIERVNAIAAQLDVRSKLESDGKLTEWGVDTVLIGSYARRVSIYPCHDVDVFVELPQCPHETTPEAVFTEVQRVLVEAYGERAAEQRRSMKVDGFPDDLSVDAVPAVPDDGRWRIPQTEKQPFGGRWVKDRWESTDPERLSDLSDQKQKASSAIDGEPSYRRTVRLVRQIREQHLADAEPGGLYFELLTYWAFEGGVSATSYAELLALTLTAIATQLESGVVVIEPAMDQRYDPAPEPPVLAMAASVFRSLADDAQGALGLDECPAAVVWRRIVGTNERGPCFPLPPGCLPSGEVIEALPHKDRGPDEARPFA
jgi:hypothetical protein